MALRNCIYYSLCSWWDFVHECFCFCSEAVNTRDKVVRGLVKSRVEFSPAQICGVFWIMCAPVRTNFGLAESTETSIKCKSIPLIFPRGKGLFSNTDLEMVNAIEEMRWGSFGFSEYSRESRKIILKEELKTGERDFGEWCVKWGWLAYMTSTVCDIYTFAVLSWFIQPFCCFTRTPLWRALHVVL